MSYASFLGIVFGSLRKYGLALGSLILASYSAGLTIALRYAVRCVTSYSNSRAEYLRRLACFYITSGFLLRCQVRRAFRNYLRVLSYLMSGLMGSGIGTLLLDGLFYYNVQACIGSSSSNVKYYNGTSVELVSNACASVSRLGSGFLIKGFNGTLFCDLGESLCVNFSGSQGLFGITYLSLVGRIVREGFTLNLLGGATLILYGRYTYGILNFFITLRKRRSLAYV